MDKWLLMALDEPQIWRPFVILSAAVSLDGKLATVGGDTNISTSNDWSRVHRLRMESDAIMVGGGTIRKDDSKLVVDSKKLGAPVSRQPLRVIVSATGNIPLDARAIIHCPEIPTLIAITSHCSTKQEQRLSGVGCQVIQCGNNTFVDLSLLMRILKTEFKVDQLMVEGGGRLNGSMLSLQLIDEIQLAYAPVIAGNGTSIFELSQSIQNFSESPLFEIRTFGRIDDMLWIRFKVHYTKRQLI
jgi:2,5-diamino-6-(ribosylamino)-4(3H)-pyrimidinone 5'-phosphate reductase